MTLRFFYIPSIFVSWIPHQPHCLWLWLLALRLDSRKVNGGRFYIGHCFLFFFLHGTVLTNELFMLSSDVRTLIAFVSWSNKISFSLLKHELCINVKNEYVQEKSCKTSWESQQLPFPKKQRIWHINDSSPNHQNVTIIYKCHWQHSNPMYKAFRSWFAILNCSTKLLDFSSFAKGTDLYPQLFFQTCNLWWGRVPIISFTG